MLLIIIYFFPFQTLILWAMHFIPGLRLRVPEQTEIIGIDECEMGEFAYDYVGVVTELKPLAYARETYELRAGKTDSP